MSNSAAEPAAVGVIETDAFCDGCGFNLHSQKVWRDERLAIPVCRCPECGKHSAAGANTTSNSMWLRRLALVGMACWIAFQIVWVATLFFGLLGAQAIASEGLINSRYETKAGDSVDMTYNTTLAAYEFKLESDPSQIIPNNAVIYRNRLAPWLRGQPTPSADEGRFASPGQALVIAFVFGVPAFIAAVMLATFAWHWRRGLKWLWLLVPILSSAFVYSLMATKSSRGWNGVAIVNDADERKLVILVLVLQLIVIAAGLAVGRRVARLGLMVFVPPKTRQLFAFLWHCDGLTMPASSSAAPAVR